MNDHEREDEHPFDQGLQHDLQVLHTQANRRKVLGWIAAAGLVPIVGCSSSAAPNAGASAGAAGSDGADAGNTDASCSPIPEETGGPYPADATNGPDALTASGIVRDDITTSFGDLKGTAKGIPLTITLQIVNASSDCAGLAGYAVYLWHCDRDGNYSLYTVEDQNYLRGVQETADDGTVTFESIFPACYAGRWPHIHFEVYENLDTATIAGPKLRTSQLALPKDQCDEVYATKGYEDSVDNLAQVSLDTDMVFSDGADLQTLTVTGNVDDGYTATLVVGL